MLNAEPVVSIVGPSPLSSNPSKRPVVSRRIPGNQDSEHSEIRGFETKSCLLPSDFSPNTDCVGILIVTASQTLKPVLEPTMD